jgi:hypothetical protein
LFVFCVTMFGVFMCVLRLSGDRECRLEDYR